MSSSNSNVFIGKYNKVLYNTILLGFSEYLPSWSLQSHTNSIKSSFNSCIADFDGIYTLSSFEFDDLFSLRVLYSKRKEKARYVRLHQDQVLERSDEVRSDSLLYALGGRLLITSSVSSQAWSVTNPLQDTIWPCTLLQWRSPKGVFSIPWFPFSDELAERVASLRLYCLSSPLVYLCDLYKSNSITTLPVYEVSLNPPESLYFFFVSVSIVSYLYGNDQNLNFTFSLHNSDSMNVFITQVFLQEFCDTQRTVPSAPLFTFSKGVPEDLKQESIATLPNVGFVTFSISYSFLTHVSSLVEEAYDVQELWVDCANHLLLQKLLELPLDDHQDVHAHRHEK